MITRYAPFLLAAVVSACGSTSGTGDLTELTRVQSGDIDVVLLSEDGAISHDADTFVIEFRSTADGSLVDPGQVKASATMPMPGSSPMFGSVELMPSGTPGRYTGTSNLSMAGTWRIAVEWQGPGGAGSAVFSPSVQ